MGRPQKHLVRVGRIATVVVVFFGILWISVMKVVSERSAGLYDYLQNDQGMLAPPIAAVFLLGVFYKRINGGGAFWGLVIGFVLGMGKLTLQTLVQSGVMAPTGPLGAIGAFNGYYFTGVLFAISIAIIVGLSLMTPPEPEEKIAGLAFQAAKARPRVQPRPDLPLVAQGAGAAPDGAVPGAGGAVATAEPTTATASPRR